MLCILEPSKACVTFTYHWLFCLKVSQTFSSADSESELANSASFLTLRLLLICMLKNGSCQNAT